MDKLLYYFKNIDNISHAFLIGNVVFDDIKEELTDVISKKLFNNEEIDIKKNPDIYYYDQNISLITKDEIKELLSELSLTSQINGNKVYIINGCEKMSDTVSNALLKTLEEPENNIYAFLITKNIDSVKATIKSRCQILLINTEDKKEIEEESEKLSSMIINLIEEKEIKGIDYNNEIYSLVEDREKFQKILNVLLKKYDVFLKSLLNNEKKQDYYEIIKKNDIISLSKKILVINNFQKLSDSYLNKNLMIDRFFIEMWRCRK